MEHDPRKRLHAEVVLLLEQHCDIVECIDLVKVDLKLDQLVELLYNFSQAITSPADKLVIMHHDTDYYPTLSSCGNSIYNILRLCATFGIPLINVIFITNHYGIGKEINDHAQLICNDTNITVIETSLWYDYPPVEIESQVSDSCTSNLLLFSCLNGQSRQSRIFTLCLLLQEGMLEDGIISYHFGDNT